MSGPPTPAPNSSPETPRLSRLIQDQSRLWQRGDRPRVESLFERYPLLAAETEVVLDLIYHEMLLRRRLGETIDLGEYQARFPDLAEVLRAQVEIGMAFLSTEAPTEEAPQTTLPWGGDGEPSVPGYE